MRRLRRSLPTHPVYRVLIFILGLTLLATLLSACSRNGSKKNGGKIMKALRTKHLSRVDPGQWKIKEFSDVTTVSLNGDFVPQEAVDLVEKQSGYSLSIYGPPPTNKKTLELTDVPFWEAVITIRNSFGFYIENLGGTILFKQGTPRRSPCQVTGPFLVSRYVPLDPGSEVPDLIQELDSEDPEVVRYAHGELKERTRQDLPDDYRKWKNWYEEEGQHMHPEEFPLHPNWVVLEIWSEPGISIGPFLQPPQIRLIAGKKTVKSMYSEVYLQAKHRAAWKFVPPLSNLEGKLVTLKGYLFPALQAGKIKTDIPLKEGTTRKIESPSTRITVTSIREEQSDLRVVLEVVRQPDVSAEKLEKARAILKITESKSREEISIDRLNWYRQFYRSVYQEPASFRLPGQKEGEEGASLLRQKKSSINGRTYEILIPNRKDPGNLTLSVELFTNIKEDRIPLNLKPIYLNKPAPRYQTTREK